MKLTNFTDYSLRVLIYLASQPQRRTTIAEVACAFDVSENHLTKVVHFLAKQGWLSTARGRGGGITLGMPAGKVAVGQVVRATEGEAMPAECFGEHSQACCIASVCALRGVLQEAVASFYAALDKYTLADLTRNAPTLVAVLHMRPLKESGRAVRAS